MKRSLLAASLATLPPLALALLGATLPLARSATGAAAPHGGAYPPPFPPPPPPAGGTHTGPGDSPGPTTPPPPPPSSPGPSTPPSTRGPAERPRTGPATPPPSSPGPAAPAGPKMAPVTPPTPGQGDGDPASWQVFWAYNRDPYLRLREHVQAAVPATGEAGFFLGRGHAVPASATGRPTATDLRERIVPALLAALETERDAGLRQSAVVALGQLGEPRADVAPGETASAEPLGVRAAIERCVGAPNQRLSEEAVVALGLLRDPRAVPLLAALALDEPRGARALDRDSVPTRLRAFAVYALALVGERSAREDVKRFVVHTLERVWDADLAEQGSGTSDLGVACALGFGLVRLSDPAATVVNADRLPASASRGGQVRYLLAKLADPRLDTLVRAHVPRSLARLVDPTVVPPPAPPFGSTVDPFKHEVVRALSLLLGPRADEPRLVRYGAALALGLLGDADDDAEDRLVRATLERTTTRGGDPLERHLALAALGQVAGRAGRGDGDPLAATAGLRRHLERELARGKSRAQPWAGLALGLVGAGLTDGGAAADPGADEALRAALTRCRTPLDVGAYALALGLRRDPLADALLAEKLDAFADDGARAHLAVAIGLARGETAGDALRELVLESRYRPLLMRELAIGLALGGDPESVPLLVDIVTSARSLASQAAAVSALGWVGDARAVDALLAIIADPRVVARARSLAVAALGSLADPDPLPWTASYTTGLNWLAQPETLHSTAGTGLLNMR